MGFEIPDAWREVPAGWTEAAWRRNLYTAIGNGVPPFMSRAFGEAAATAHAQRKAA
ncbi:hypothetical protein [Deinococcus sp. S9]|uniref:hypothetical protein n=1 Tax=Deinococcus sp. S9 TaxID=2545754 RepID=UPI001404AE74|nr:hypothetical protein [Deinococcus sp. S9]